MASRYTVPASVPQEAQTGAGAVYMAQTSGIKRERSPDRTMSQCAKKQKVASQDETQEESWEEEQYESWDEDQLDQFDNDGEERYESWEKYKYDNEGEEEYESWEEEQYEREEEEQDEVAAQLAQAALAGIGPDQKKSRGTAKTKGKEPEEKRCRRYRSKPPITYLDRLDRAMTQRMFLIDRHRRVSADGTHEVETFDIAGSTGNVYKVTISKAPSCTCPDAYKGNQCKHIIYVMVHILKVREELSYQLGLLSTELAEIFANAPVPPQSADTGGNRKPIEGDCPVCMMEFDPSDKTEEIIWCKGACGNNIHRHCFEQWAKTKLGEARCVYCRAPWKGDEESIKRIAKAGRVNHEGYVNVGGELGLPTERDTSTYFPRWVRRALRDNEDPWYY